MVGPEGAIEIGLGFGLLFAADVAPADAATATAAISDAITSQRAKPFFGECGTTRRASSKSVSKRGFQPPYMQFAIASTSPIVR
jgi:hypothetical protein